MLERSEVITLEKITISWYIFLAWHALSKVILESISILTKELSGLVALKLSQAAKKSRKTKRPMTKSEWLNGIDQ